MRKPIGVHFTDLHLEDETTEVCHSIAIQCLKLAVKLGVSYVFNGGDTFQSRKSQTLSSLKAFESILDEYESEGVTMITIDGNHDKLMYNSQDSYHDAFKHHPAMMLIKTWSCPVSTTALDIFMLSFFSDNNQCTSNSMYVDMLKSISNTAGSKSKKKRILITHHGFDGAKSNSGTPIESDISVSLLSCFDTTLIGHYHDDSKLNSSVFYTGSCRQAWFTEKKRKGFTIIYDDGSIEFRQSEFKAYTEIDVVLTGDYSKKISETIKLLKTDFADDFKRIHLIGDKASSKSVNVQEIKLAGIDVRTTDTTNPVGQEETSEGFSYVEFNEEKVAGLFLEFVDEEGITDDTDLEYAADVLNRAISSYKQSN